MAEAKASPQLSSAVLLVHTHIHLIPATQEVWKIAAFQTLT